VLVPSIPMGKADLSALRDNTPDELMRLAATTGGKSRPTGGRRGRPGLADRRVRRRSQAARDAALTRWECMQPTGTCYRRSSPASTTVEKTGWGGSLENPARLTTEVLVSRAAMGPDMALLVWISGRSSARLER
jgi:hypothetical protein